MCSRMASRATPGTLHARHQFVERFRHRACGGLHVRVDRRRHRGGSSGSGIAPAAGFSSGSIGEDTGGSIRGPAAANGVVGLRPTFGRVSRYGGLMYAWTADTLGPITRTVEDNALFLGAIAGFDARDPLTSRRSVPDYTAAMTPTLKGMRLAVVAEMTWPAGVHAEVKSA